MPLTNLSQEAHWRAVHGKWFGCQAFVSAIDDGFIYLSKPIREGKYRKSPRLSPVGEIPGGDAGGRMYSGYAQSHTDKIPDCISTGRSA